MVGSMLGDLRASSAMLIDESRSVRPPATRYRVNKHVARTRLISGHRGRPGSADAVASSASASAREVSRCACAHVPEVERVAEICQYRRTEGPLGRTHFQRLAQGVDGTSKRALTAGPLILVQQIHPTVA
jgi:hypothetical protein